MGKYTIQVRTIVENFYYEIHPELSVEQVKATNPKVMTDAVWFDIFDFDFPMYSGTTKQVLCSLILRHYYMREIGLETFPLWKLQLETRMNEIMPYYVQLADATITLQEAFQNRNVKEDTVRAGTGREDIERSDNGESSDTLNSSQDGTADRESSGKTTASGSTKVEGSNTSNTNVENNTQKLISDTPQDGLQNVLNGTYLSQADIGKENGNTGNTSSGESTETRTQNGTEEGKDLLTTNQTTNQTKVGTESRNGKENRDKEYNESVGRTVVGFDGDKVDTLMKYRETLLQIPRMIIRDLNDLFISIL